MRELSLLNDSRKIQIDDKNFQLLSKYKWYLDYDNNKNPKSIISTNGLRLSRLILKTIETKIEVDHKDRNIFNNLESNLRLVNRSKNLANRDKHKDNKSGYKGVYWDSINNKWRASICKNKNVINLGRFEDKILAAIAYDDAAINYFGEYAKLNFPLYGA